jgi:hypothetical protein
MMREATNPACEHNSHAGFYRRQADVHDRSVSAARYLADSFRPKPDS